PEISTRSARPCRAARPEWSRRPRGLQRIGNRKHVGEPSDLEDLYEARVRSDVVEITTQLAAPLECADEHAECGGVQERDPEEVQDNRRLACSDDAVEALSQLRRRRDVDLPAHGDHRGGDARPLFYPKLLIHSALLPHVGAFPATLGTSCNGDWPERFYSPGADNLNLLGASHIPWAYIRA